MTKAVFDSLGVTAEELKMLAIVPHRWDEVLGGAIVFFVPTTSSKVVNLCFYIPPASTAFWQAIEDHPLIHEMVNRDMISVPMTLAELNVWKLENEFFLSEYPWGIDLSIKEKEPKDVPVPVVVSQR